MVALAERLVALGDVASTMDEARARPPGTAAAPNWVMAERQLAGRGRRGRAWASPSGNLNATARFVWKGNRSELPLVCLVAAVATCEAIAVCRPAAASTLNVKWPNDVLMGEGKLAGLLVESEMRGGVTDVAIGIGVNLVAVIDAGRETAHLDGLTPRALLEALDEALISQLRLWRQEGFEPIRRRWERWGPAAGDWVAPSALAGQRGRYAGLAADGALIVDTDDGRTTLSSGELG